MKSDFEDLGLAYDHVTIILEQKPMIVFECSKTR